MELSEPFSLLLGIHIPMLVTNTVYSCCACLGFHFQRGVMTDSAEGILTVSLCRKKLPRLVAGSLCRAGVQRI